MPTELFHSETTNHSRPWRYSTRSRDGTNTVERDTPYRCVLQVTVVAEDRDTSNGIAAVVRQWGHVARTIHDGRAARREHVAIPPDVVLLDIEPILVLFADPDEALQTVYREPLAEQGIEVQPSTGFSSCT